VRGNITVWNEQTISLSELSVVTFSSRHKSTAVFKAHALQSKHGHFAVSGLPQHAVELMDGGGQPPSTPKTFEDVG
jgi:hypothetical protein